MRAVKDSEGNTVKAGSILRFNYGIPPVGVRATVIERDGKLIALTPSHNPKECPVASLKRYVGDFRVEDRQR